jgi:hypothetical protein
MYRNDAKLYDGDLFAILTLILLPCVLFVLWWVLIYSLPPKNLPETSKYYRTAPRMLSLSFWIMGVGVVLLGIFGGNWAYSGRVDLPLLIPGSGLFLVALIIGVIFRD